MPIARHPHLRLLATALALALSSMLLAAPAVSMASRSARRPACSRHSKRRAHGCARSGSRRRGHTGHAPARRHRSHAPAKPAGTAGTTPAAAPPAVLAVCADGSAPLLAAEETFSCGDGSEPGCEAGSTLTVSGDGSRLLCGASAEGFDLEASCEPGLCEGDGGKGACEAAAPDVGEADAEPCEEAPEGAGAANEG